MSDSVTISVGYDLNIHNRTHTRKIIRLPFVVTLRTSRAQYRVYLSPSVEHAFVSVLFIKPHRKFKLKKLQSLYAVQICHAGSRGSSSCASNENNSMHVWVTIEWDVMRYTHFLSRTHEQRLDNERLWKMRYKQQPHQQQRTAAAAAGGAIVVAEQISSIAGRHCWKENHSFRTEK